MLMLKSICYRMSEMFSCLNKHEDEDYKNNYRYIDQIRIDPSCSSFNFLSFVLFVFVLCFVPNVACYVSLDCSFLIASSVFSNVYLENWCL